jgi:hypothetical protein
MSEEPTEQSLPPVEPSDHVEGQGAPAGDQAQAPHIGETTSPATHIEVQEALGDHALGGEVVSDPSSETEAVKENPVATDPSNYIEDPEEAHDVAVTSKSVRDEWAASRLAGDTMESYVAEHGEDAIPSDSSIGEHEQVISNTLAERGLEIGDVEMNALSTGRGRLERGENGEPINTSHRFAEQRLEEAERLEKWASVLHGKQLKPDFVKQNLIPEGEPEHEITAADLAHLETTSTNERLTATGWSNQLASMEAADRKLREQEGERVFAPQRWVGQEQVALSLMPLIDRKTRGMLDRWGDQVQLDEYSRLDQDDGTTNKDRKNFYDGLCHDQARRHEMAAAVIENKLEEISSGQALEDAIPPQTEEQTPGDEATPQDG